MPGALSPPVLSLLELCFCGLVGRPRPLAPAVSAASTKPLPCSFLEGGSSETARTQKHWPKGLGGEGVCFSLSLCSSWLRFRYRWRWRAASNAAASNAAAFSSSLDGGELFSRIQDRGDQAFTERGREPTGTWGFVFAPHLGVYRSASGPARSLSHCFEASAGFCTWG